MQKKLLTGELVTRENRYSFMKHIGMLPNPDKIIGRGGRSYETLRDLKNDPHVWSCVQSRKSGVLSLDWEIEGDDEISKNVAELLNYLDIYAIISEILEAPLFGFQALEIIWDYSASTNLHFVPISISPKPQEWFFFDNDGILKYNNGSGLEGVAIPDEKILNVRHEATYMNPYGTALLSKCYWSCTFKNGGLRFWVNFMEKFGMPVLLGKYTRGASDEEIKHLAEVLGNMTENSVIVSPSDIEIKLEEAVRTSSVDLYYELIKLCNAEISKALLSQTLTTELDSGSYAASQTHFTIRKEVVRSDIRLVEHSINRLISIIFKLNGISGNPAKFRIKEPMGNG